MSSAADYFTGYFRISQDVQSNLQLQSYIDKYEKKYLVDLLGYELYSLFVADIDSGTGLPQTARFTVIYNELNYEVNGGSQYNWIPYGLPYSIDRTSKEIPYQIPTLSDGISKMLKGFVFFHYVSEMSLSITPTGVIENRNENSDKSASNRVNGLIEDRFNDSIKSYKVIQRYINDNSDTYPEFMGIDKSPTFFGGSF
jgi:hypothetical protein